MNDALKDKVLSIAKGALIAALGAALAYVAQAAAATDFGAYTPIVVAALSVAVNAVRKLSESNAKVGQ